MAPNDRFVRLESVPDSSTTIINIAGLHVYLFGVDELTPAQAEDTTVLFHVHGRTRTYKDAEEIAHQLLHDWRLRGSGDKGLVVATFDNRNHGTRSIDELSIQDWKSGNGKHAQDMLSMIDGIVADVQTTVTFLESYVDGIFIPKAFIITGLSLGGHVSWDVLAKDPRIRAGVIIVGSPNLTPMLLERLGDYKSIEEVPAGTKEWPKSIEKLYLNRDKSLEGISGKKLLILNGAVDPLVPTKFTHPWIEKYAAKNDVTFIEQEETGHWFSVQMMDKLVDWVVETVV
ncbi:Alpha/Beta hydrolase protein [Thelonectria olida]|uniref:Alpha/Beta hydrolase protein n=1 Tax=Thelonectria olida TaxID=1576542 RepID=A0A9P8VVK6_9HYPO|nr:Alpha/Beta hydrolase protein [Thelonectria olida]